MDYIKLLSNDIPVVCSCSYVLRSNPTLPSSSHVKGCMWWILTEQANLNVRMAEEIEKLQARVSQLEGLTNVQA